MYLNVRPSLVSRQPERKVQVGNNSVPFLMKGCGGGSGEGW